MKRLKKTDHSQTTNSDLKLYIMLITSVVLVIISVVFLVNNNLNSQKNESIDRFSSTDGNDSNYQINEKIAAEVINQNPNEAISNKIEVNDIVGAWKRTSNATDDMEDFAYGSATLDYVIFFENGNAVLWSQEMNKGSMWAYFIKDEFIEFDSHNGIDKFFSPQIKNGVLEYFKSPKGSAENTKFTLVPVSMEEVMPGLERIKKTTEYYRTVPLERIDAKSNIDGSYSFNAKFTRFEEGTYPKIYVTADNGGEFAFLDIDYFEGKTYIKDNGEKGYIIEDLKNQSDELLHINFSFNYLSKTAYREAKICEMVQLD